MPTTKQARLVDSIIQTFDEKGIPYSHDNTCLCDECNSDNLISVVTLETINPIHRLCLNCGNTDIDANVINILLANKELADISIMGVVSEDEGTNVEVSNFDVVRPNGFAEIYGNTDIISDLQVLIGSSRQRSEALENMLFYGPPGLGKTTIASVVATERGVGFIPISASIIKKNDIMDVLSNIKAFDVLFIDEIHDLNKSLALVLYTAMEDNYIDVVDDGKPVRIGLPDFTIIGATTDAGKLLPAMRSRFGNQYTLSLYPHDVLYDIIVGAANKLNVGASVGAVNNIAMRSRGTPRNAISLLKKSRAYADVYNANHQFVSADVIGPYIDDDIAKMAFDAAQIDVQGLTQLDRSYLEILNDLNIAGVDTIAATMGDSESNLSEMVEPWLLAQGYILRTSRGRQITEKGKQYVSGMNGVLTLN